MVTLYLLRRAQLLGELAVHGQAAARAVLVPGADRLTQFSAALIATKILAAHIASRS